MGLLLIALRADNLALSYAVIVAGTFLTGSHIISLELVIIIRAFHARWHISVKRAVFEPIWVVQALQILCLRVYDKVWPLLYFVNSSVCHVFAAQFRLGLIGWVSTFFLFRDSHLLLGPRFGKKLRIKSRPAITLLSIHLVLVVGSGLRFTFTRIFMYRLFAWQLFLHLTASWYSFALIFFYLHFLMIQLLTFVSFKVRLLVVWVSHDAVRFIKIFLVIMHTIRIIMILLFLLEGLSAIFVWAWHLCIFLINSSSNYSNSNSNYNLLIN